MVAKRFIVAGCACLVAVLSWPSEAAAQRRAVRVVRRPAVSSVVFIGGGYYRPFYYDPFFWGWYPVYPQYPPYYWYGRSYSSARIEVKPRNAQVYLDGYYVGIVDQYDGVFQRLDIPPGEHELHVYLEGYKSYREKTLFLPGREYRFRAVLEPLASGETPEPRPEPATSPPPPERYAPNPPAGAGRTVPLPERRGERRPESAGFGTLAIRVQPTDAIVTVDGERWDSPEGGSRLQVQLPAGAHRIEIRKEGYKPYVTSVQIRSGETETLNVSLPVRDPRA